MKIDKPTTVKKNIGNPSAFSLIENIYNIIAQWNFLVTLCLFLIAIF